MSLTSWAKCSTECVCHESYIATHTHTHAHLEMSETEIKHVSDKRTAGEVRNHKFRLNDMRKITPSVFSDG